MPRTRGRIVRQEDQGWSTPPEETATSAVVREVMKMKPPVQSTRLSFSRKPLRSVWRLTKKNDMGRAMPQMGRLIQKHHRQVASWTKVPPRMGPRTVPSAQAPRTKAKYRGR